MKHSGEEARGALAGLLGEMRLYTALVEKKPGIFYWKGQAFAHFHEDAAGLFGDLKEQDGWRRMDVTGAEGQAAFAAAAGAVLQGGKKTLVLGGVQRHNRRK